VSSHPSDTGVDVVTGAFSYSGRAIAAELLRQGRRVRTLTGHPERAGAGATVQVLPLDFDDLPAMVAGLRGATTLYNTYWVRFAHGRRDHDLAVQNSRALFYAARRAGIQRVVHVSITHPTIESPYPYFRGKALVERALAETGIPYAILRPAILFGGDGVLINNIAWLLRHLPVFAVGGRGDYRVRAIHVDDLAEIAVAAGVGGLAAGVARGGVAARDVAADVVGGGGAAGVAAGVAAAGGAAAPACDDAIIDAVGPERPTFLELVQSIRSAVGSRSLIVRVPGIVVPVAAAGLNLALRDVLLTKDEYNAMADNLADTTGPATGHTSLSDWIVANRSSLGLTYANELNRHFRS
jgi:uncharacterized protein YbjT (DUF2867 family)